MFGIKLGIVGLTAATNVALAAIGGALAGALILKGAQKMSEPKKVVITEAKAA